MGTRADFYVGRGEKAEWLGSIAWDGYPSGFPSRDGSAISPLTARTENDFRVWVEAELKGRKDGTEPADGWPWPWEDSGTTDYAYAFDDGQVFGSCFGGKWFKASEPEPDTEDDERPGDKAVFPNMKTRQKVTFGERSGIIVIGGPK